MATPESNCRLVEPEALLCMLLIETPDCRTVNAEIPIFWVNMPRVLGDHYAFGTRHEIGLNELRHSGQIYISVATPHTQYVMISQEATEPVMLLTVFLATQTVFAQMDLSSVAASVDAMARLDGADQAH